MDQCETLSLDGCRIQRDFHWAMGIRLYAAVFMYFVRDSFAGCIAGVRCLPQTADIQNSNAEKEDEYEGSGK